ncbi:Hypothetical protein FKW44_020945 [Caligus rogercresseyi]|uniref:Uncharacterized protein n=1 Tax=Caligus rogercresseyi TaxID=217165 RepID=A0A7T8JUS9_CALRO|nr:Hypothetical protein FKW44_020945 [Caligus rogercresseyi]
MQVEAKLKMRKTMVLMDLAEARLHPSTIPRTMTDRPTEPHPPPPPISQI